MVAKKGVPKRDGSRRKVAQPAREVKEIQRWIVKELRAHLPIHASVTAYEEGSSIIRNANAHRTSRFILKMDFRNFFPSITLADLAVHLGRYCSNTYDPSELRQLLFACVWTPTRRPPLTLCIGAPSSPFLSNSILYDFDVAMTKRTEVDGVVYTRYADDLTFSSAANNVLQKYPKLVRAALKKIESPRLRVNASKTVHASRAGRRIVTGLVITPDGHLSVGRDRKRLVRAMFHRDRLGLLTTDEKATLAGLLAFIDGVEPGFSSKLQSRYR